MMKHYSVLKNEVIEGLNINPDGIYVDATLGYGGHSEEILKRLRRGFLFAFDQDEDAISFGQERLSKVSNNFKIIYANFSNLKAKLYDEKITKVDGVVFDLGLSSPQIDEISRGFTFMHDAPLDMRMDKNNKLSAWEVINKYKLEDLINIFFTYGEERYSKSIAKNIVKERQNKKITRTTELVNIIKYSVPLKYFLKNHPERQIFQAIRIEVNNELNILKNTLKDVIDILNPKGRICIITFHSLEDRIVKHIFKKESDINNLVKGLPIIPEEYQPLIKLINKKPILPSEEELKVNTRSKSAKLRIIERL
ncbi:MAG: 16S rRNA (cytosine(1402)-N(4))-methyltransferase RsmH [Bacilli bacterium]|nr:16S rRNA (cytosine(1402)-N(4))-methyltransferase RsmH [Bacilli bacterium]MDD4406945.1 16S rRNA (cytosine(1402)-N(4))-methyltransferase RsmH [Bacilli bacterium]